MSKEKDLLIKITDSYGEFCLHDNVISDPLTKKRGPQGRVEIFEITDDNKKKLIQKSNLVVYVGRELIAQRIVDTENANVNTDKDEYISWLGLGDGGVDPADPFDPIPPTNSDTDLASEVPLNNSDASYADFRVGNYYKAPLQSIEFEQDTANDDAWLIVKITVQIQQIDAIGEQISECGLFSSLSDAGGYAGPFHLFARATFPTIVKTATRQLLVIWYLYT